MTPPRFGVYVHWPYCGRICPYCDFNVYRARGRDPQPLLGAIAADIAEQARRFALPPAETVFLGGGTPSLLTGAQVEGVLAAVERSMGLAPNCEVTLEANPEDAARFADHVAAGVTRLSLGVQALNDADLKALGRAHDAAAARAAVEAAAATGARVSLDLIYARHGQTVAAWEAELRDALAMPVEHWSLYQLTIEEGTAFHRAAVRGALRPPAAGDAADFFDVTQALCSARGAPAYEISNHALSEAAWSRHNLVYWTGGDWLGVGPGAHGRLSTAQGRRATQAIDRPGAYIAAVSAAGVGWSEDALLTPSEAGDELLVMGLRSSLGMPRADIEAAWGRPMRESAVTDLAAAGLIETVGDRLRLTPAGRLVADRVALELSLPGS